MVLLYCFISEGVLLKKLFLSCSQGNNKGLACKTLPHSKVFSCKYCENFYERLFCRTSANSCFCHFWIDFLQKQRCPEVLHKKSVWKNFRKFVRNIYLFKFNNRNTIKGPETPVIHICFRIEWLVWEILHMVSIIAQQTFTCSKSTIETLRKDMEYVQSYHSRHQNDCWSFLWK